MAQCDFYLLGKLHLSMKDMPYADIPAIQRVCIDIFRALLTSDLRSTFEMVLSRANQCIETEAILSKMKQYCRKIICSSYFENVLSAFTQTLYALNSGAFSSSACKDESNMEQRA